MITKGKTIMKTYDLKCNVGEVKYLITMYKDNEVINMHMLNNKKKMQALIKDIKLNGYKKLGVKPL